ncbi:MAG: hypothetical protein AB1486_22285 [Planctomycetota bacterium]
MMMKRKSETEGSPVDMPSDAIDRPMRDVAQLHRLGRELKSARRVGPMRDRREAERSERK